MTLPTPLRSPDTDHTLATRERYAAAVLTPVLVPLRRFALMGAAAVALAAVRIPGRPHTVCLLRATTGLPCPFCGGTTAAADVGRAHLGQAMGANPLVVLGALAVVLAATPWGRRALAAWRALPPATRVVLGGTVLLAGECWQLVRFGLL